MIFDISPGIYAALASAFVYGVVLILVGLFLHRMFR